ncbi:MAG: hypothetical protein ACR2FH_03770, partial [Caulobacteraceae bacterium]
MTEPAFNLHPRNRDFAWRSGPAEGLRRVGPEQKRQFDQLGYFVLENAFAPAELAAVEAAIDPLEREHEAAMRAGEAGNAISSADAITF